VAAEVVAARVRRLSGSFIMFADGCAIAVALFGRNYFALKGDLNR
jgi:hypothetical protein